MNAAWDIRCSCAKKIVLVALCNHASANGECWPGLSRLERHCGLSRQGVIDQIEALEKRGLISVIREPGKANRYVVHVVNHVDQSPVKDVDQYESASQPPRLVVVKDVDCHQSTTLTIPVNHVDPNLNESSVEPSIELPSAEAILIFACNGKVKEWALTAGKLEEWEGSFPQTDVMACCRKALQWTRDNERKTAKGMTAFLGRWIGKAADRGECRRTVPIEREEWVKTEPIDMMAGLKVAKAERDAAIRAEEEEHWT